MTSNCTVIHGDVLEALRSFEDNTFGAVITDPPYASGGLHAKERQATTAAKYTKNKTNNPLPNFEGDNKDQLSWMLWCTAWLREVKRVCKRGTPICVFIDFRQLDALKWVMQWADWLVNGIVVWDKTEAARPQLGRFRSQCEFILWGSKGAMSVNRNVPVLKGCYRYPTLNKDKLHQTQKPLALMQDIVKIVEPGETILDPFAGSGTTLIAALHEGYNAVGIEVTKEYATIAQKQIDPLQPRTINQQQGGHNVNAIRVCELFCGIGGFRYGLEKASHQFETVFANEMDKWAASIYRRHWPDNSLQEGDIRNIQTKDVSDFDLLCGGFPCQPFSMAGKRQGTSDPRGTLFYEILRFAREKQPKMLLLENVPGLLSIDHGNVFETILASLAELGYIREWTVLDSKYFGVPQQRRRVFIIGYPAKLARCRGTVFPIKPRSAKCTEKVAGGKVSTTLTASYGTKCNIGGNTFVTQQIVPIITSHIGKGGGSDPLIVQSCMQGEVRVYDKHVPILRACMGTGGNNVPLVSMILGDHTGGNIKQRTRAVMGNPSWTLGGCQTLVKENQVIRRLTPLECERLQGFPDNWTSHGQTLRGETIEISKTQRYKTLGNAVTTNVITAIGELILNFLNKAGIQ